MKCKICDSESLSPLYTVGGYTIWQCKSCQFGQVFIEPAELAAFYDEEYFSGKKAHFAQQRRDPVRPAVGYWVEHYLKMLNPRPNLSVAEIGPGPSAGVGHYFREHHPEVAYEAIEISEFAAQCLREDGFTAYTGRVNDPEILGKCESKFDMVIGTEVIEHDPDPRGFASAVFGMLKPGGICAFTTGNLTGWMARRKKANWYYINPPAHVSYYSVKSATHLFEDIGFSRVSTWKTGFQYIDLQLKYKLPGILFFADALNLPTGMSISAVRS